MSLETVDDSKRSVVISVNPNSGASDQQAVARELERLLIERGFDVHVPESIPQLRSEIMALEKQGSLRTIVAAGGDGTAAMLVNEVPFSCPLTMLPLGTENLLAKYLTITSDPEQVCRLIVKGGYATLDIGKANDKYFLVMCSCGFDADVVKRLHSVRKGHISHWSYARPILDAISRYRYPTLKIKADGKPDVWKSKWAFVFNVPRYAMNLPIVPDANCMDGELDLCTFKRGYLLQGLLYLAGVVLRQHRHWKDTRFAKVKTLTIVSDESEEPVPFQLDGDPGGVLPLTIEVVPNFLKVAVGEAWISQNSKQLESQRERIG